MKKFRLSIAVLLAAWGLAGMGDVKADNGAGTAGVKVEKSESKKVRMYTQPGKSVDVSLIDANGTVLYRGIVNNRKPGATLFNLKNLPDGQYYLTAGNNEWWMSQGISIQGDAINVDQQSLQRVEQPTLTAYEKNKIEVVLPSSNLNSANVTIYDMQSVPVYAGTFNGKSRRFDLSSLPDGAYTVLVGPEQKQFVSRIDIRH